MGKTVSIKLKFVRLHSTLDKVTSKYMAAISQSVFALSYHHEVLILGSSVVPLVFCVIWWELATWAAICTWSLASSDCYVQLYLGVQAWKLQKPYCFVRIFIRGPISIGAAILFLGVQTQSPCNAIGNVRIFRGPITKVLGSLSFFHFFLSSSAIKQSMQTKG